MHELRDPVLDGLADEALDRRPVAFCSYLPTRLEDVAELADEALDRPAHPNLACITVSTGEFTKYADGVELADVDYDRPPDGSLMCNVCTRCRQSDGEDWMLADEALDRPAHPNLACISVSTGEFTKHADGAELADEALDRPAHPNLACISVSTGEFTKHADGADLADEVVGRPARSAAATSRRVRTSRARAR